MAMCEYPDCGRTMHARGLCGAHYQQWKHGGELHPVGPPGRPRKATEPGWTPSNGNGLSGEWHEAMRRKALRARRPEMYLSDEKCAKGACGAWAMEGSDMCPAHHHYRAHMAAQGQMEGHYD